MRLKQSLAVLIMLLVFTMFAVAAESELSNVNVAAEGNGTTLTIQATGAFTHNEYRPADNLLLVDLSGVSAGKLNDQAKELQAPGVKSYHVLGYKGAAGSEVTRVEISLQPGATVMVNESKGGIEVRVNGGAQATSKPAAKPAAEPAKTAEAKPAESQKQEPKAASVTHEAAPSDGLVKIENVSVARSNDGIDVRISANASVTPSTMRLSGPDRIVLDLPNSVPMTRTSKIAVNTGEVKSIRIGQFQADPPVTRIVVDLTAACDYQVIPSDGNVVLKVHTSPKSSSPAPAPHMDAQEQSFVPSALKTASYSPSHSAAQVKPAAAKPSGQKYAEPIKPAVLKVAAEPKPEMAQAKPAEPAPAQQPVVASAAPEQKPAQTEQVTVAERPLAPAEQKQPAAEQKAANAQEFAVVEPQFKVKDDVDPAAKAAGAAKTVEMAKAAPAPVLSASAATSAPNQAAANLALEQQQQRNAPVASTRPHFTGDPISVNLKDVDLKDFFRLIHEISGLNIVLDPNVKGTLTLVLDDVPWDQALDIVLKNNGLDQQLEGNVLRVATVETLRKEADMRRAQAEAQALAVDKQTVTRFLSYAHAEDVVPTMKKFLSSRGDVIADKRTNALIIQDIPSVLPEIDRLLTQLDRKTQEVEIEARVVAATRNFARDIGTQLGFGWGNSGNALGGNGSVGTSQLQPGYTSPPPYFTIPGFDANKVQTDPTKPPTVQNLAIPLFSNLAAGAPTSGLSFTHLAQSWRLDALLTMAESRGLLKILSRPRVVTQNNITALVRQGFRVPIVTQAQLGGPPTVTYVDAFLRLTVTPQITVENTIFLAVDVENTTPDFSRTVQGNPTLITQQATTQVLVTNGGTVVIGGVIQTTNSVNTSQVPLLGDIPLLGNAFKRRSVSTQTQELIFFITPKIIQT